MIKLLQGDCRSVLSTLPDESVHVCITSPPYFGLRDYQTGTWEGGDAECDHAFNSTETISRSNALGKIPGYRDRLPSDNSAFKSKLCQFTDICGKCGARRIDRQIGLEQSPAEYVATMVEVFREVRRVLRSDGTCWVVLGDSFSGKQLQGIPWSVAKALQKPYYSGRIKDHGDRRWLSAMIDGEGTICGFHHIRDNGSPRTGINFCITNSNLDLLAEAHRIWPTSRSEHQSPGKGHLGLLVTYRWIVHGIANKILLLRELYPHLIAKKRQALVAYNLLLLMVDSKRLGHTTQRDAIRDKRKFLTDFLSSLNKGTNGDLPSWLVEPPSVYEPGWILRRDIPWHKLNPMPESCIDRPTSAHEYIFLLAKSGDATFWTHRDLHGTRMQPEPDYRWVHKTTGEETREPQDGKEWRRVNLWRGHDYFYDNESVRLPPTGRTDPTIFWRKNDETSRAMEGRKNDDERVHNKTGTCGANLRSVWTMATTPFSGGHYAAFPPKLVETCVKAGTSERGVCPTCGAPWTRVLDKKPELGNSKNERKTARQWSPEDFGISGFSGNMVHGSIRACISETRGFRQSCDCPPSAPVPATVLDIFSGAGTTLLVADRMQRNAIGIELNPEYIKMTEDRIKGDSSLFAEIGQDEPAVAPAVASQISLL